MSEVTKDVNMGVSERKPSTVRVALASWIGTTIEWYDFYIYGTASALIFNKLFFPNFSALAGTLAAFATFWVGFGARPIGGIVFGHFGDRIGRKSMLVLSLILMGVGTFLIGVLPTYATAGVWAPILLVTLRFVQGIAIGGEWGGATILSVEHASQKRRGFFGGWPQAGAPAGLVLATGMFTLATLYFSPPQFAAFGWRIPFLVSCVLVIIGLIIRLRIVESPEFQRLKDTNSEVSYPVLQVFRENTKGILLIGGAFLVDIAGFYLYSVYVLSYGTVQLGIPRLTILNATLIGAVIFFIAIIPAALLSDIWGRKPVYIAGIIYTMLAVFPFFWLFETRSPGLIVLALILPQFGLALMHGPQAAFFVEQFKTGTRYSGASLGNQIGSIIGGGLLPFIAAALYAVAHASWLIALYIIALGVVGLIAVAFLRETYKAPTEVPAKEEEVAAF